MLLIDDPRFDLHDPGPSHPERVARLAAARRGVAALEVRRQTPHEAPVAALHRAHRPAFVDAVLATAGRPTRLDPDTATSEGSVEAALVAAGAAILAAETAANGEAAIVLSRPPGHHATADRAMGFCLFNHVAVAAGHLAAQGVRVAIFDPDVHHGNGTEAIFWDRADVLYASMHRFPFYPGTGARHDVGGPDARGATVNAPLPLGAGDRMWHEAFARRILPVMERFAPDVVLISAGFDGLAGDPLGGMTLTPAGMAAMWGELAARWPCAAVLEGGYHLGNLTDGLGAAGAVLAGATAPPLTRDPDGAWGFEVASWGHPLL